MAMSILYTLISKRHFQHFCMDGTVAASKGVEAWVVCPCFEKMSTLFVLFYRAVCVLEFPAQPLFCLAALIKLIKFTKPTTLTSLTRSTTLTKLTIATNSSQFQRGIKAY